MAPGENLKQYILPISDLLTNVFGFLEEDLMYARMDISPEQYITEGLVRTLKYAISIFASGYAAAQFLNQPSFFFWTPIVSVILGFFIFISHLYLPRIRSLRRKRELEKDLPYALRHMSIQIKAGLSPFEGFRSISTGYGKVSEEVEEILSEIRGGKSQIEAVENSIARNRSEQYRKIMWQIVNALRSGVNLSNALEEAVANLQEDQLRKVEDYGNDLNPIILMYLMTAVIFPSLGITMLIILSSFTGITVGLELFLGLGSFLIVIQLSILNLIKSRRPDVKSI